MLPPTLHPAAVTPKEQRSGQSSPPAAQLLQPLMPSLEQQFPGLSVSIKGKLAPPPAAPAAALHSAQSFCRIAFRSMQTAEYTVTNLEKEATQLTSQLRQKNTDLEEAQQFLIQTRSDYEKNRAEGASRSTKESSIQTD